VATFLLTCRVDVAGTSEQQRRLRTTTLPIGDHLEAATYEELRARSPASASSMSST
jgi:hypothetical protein